MLKSVFCAMTLSTLLLASSEVCHKISSSPSANEKSWINKIQHPTEMLPTSPPQTTRLVCQKDNVSIEDSSSLHWNSPEDGILSLEYQFAPDSQIVRYGFDMGTAYRGEGCAVQLNDKNLIQSEKRCGTRGCNITVLHNKKEVYDTDRGTSCEMPADYIDNFFLMSGFNPLTYQTYEGLSTIHQENGQFIMNRWIDEHKETINGKEHVSPEGIRSLRFSWMKNQQKHMLICQANSDADNAARISCKSFIQGSASWGMENFFPYPYEIPLGEAIDMDRDGQEETVHIQHFPDTHQVGLKVLLSRSQTTHTIIFALDDSTRMDAFCGHHITAKTEQFVLSEGSSAIQAILLKDGLCDGIRVYWNPSSTSLQYWRN